VSEPSCVQKKKRGGRERERERERASCYQKTLDKDTDAGEEEYKKATVCLNTLMCYCYNIHITSVNFVESPSPTLLK
jgi:hypothetical protein